MKRDMRDKLAESLLLYAVTDRHWLGDRTLYDVVRESLDGGVTFLQLREKDLDDETFFQEAVRLRDMAREYGVPFVINDNVDIAVRMDADGVHVGQSDMEAFEGPVRVAIEQIKCLCSEEHAAKIVQLFISAKEITVFCCFSLTNLPKGQRFSREKVKIIG